MEFSSKSPSEGKNADCANTNGLNNSKLNLL